jgi:hypothetical protein
VNRGRGLPYQWEQQVRAPLELATIEKPFRRVSIGEIRVGDGRVFGVKLSHIGGMIAEHMFDSVRLLSRPSFAIPLHIGPELKPNDGLVALSVRT